VEAVRTLLDWAGLFAVFTGANLVFGLVVLSLLRLFSAGFVSLYDLDSSLLLILSAAQAFVFDRCGRRA
jgi:hypothetical protein